MGDVAARTKGPLATRFAAIRVRVGDGATWANNRHLPGADAWLVGEWRAGGERKHHVSNLPSRTALRALAAAIKAHRQLKQELGLGRFEGQFWTGLHQHVPMSWITFAYLQHLRLAERRRTGSGGRALPVPGPSPRRTAGGPPYRLRTVVRALPRAYPTSALQTALSAASPS